MIRLTIQQPCLAAYRVPVFALIAKESDIQLNVIYGDELGIPSVTPEGFSGKKVPLKNFRILGISFAWHAAQYSEASNRRSDVLVLMWNTRYLSLVPALLRAKWNGVRTVLWGHGFSKNESSLRQWIRFFVTHLADAVLFYDQKTMDKCILNDWISAQKCFVASNAIDERPIQEMRERTLCDLESLSKFQIRHGLTPKKTILFVSRLAPENRLEMLLSSVSRLAEEDKSVKVVIIGKGEDELRRLRLLAEQKKITSYIIFAGPVYEEAVLAKWFLSCRVFCYPENIGLSF
jgi:glycosyltransferase involved in cell wall biosynthesis